MKIFLVATVVSVALLNASPLLAHHAPQCRYTFTAPTAEKLAKEYTDLSEYRYVVYVVGGDHLHATPPLSIAKGGKASVVADCAPYLLYATFTKTPEKLSPAAAYRCPTYAMGDQGVLLNQINFKGPVAGIFGEDVAQTEMGHLVVDPRGAPDLAALTKPKLQPGKKDVAQGKATLQKISKSKWQRIPDTQCRKVVEEVSRAEQ